MARTSRKDKTSMELVSIEKWCNYKTGLYVRLSNEETEGDITEKIENQKEFLAKFIQGKEEYQLVDIYCDNGWSGRNFNRPEWSRLIDDAKRGKVDCIIVKDLSRLGRNYIEAGNYLEKVFPFLGVRFIAVSDGYDSCKEKASLDQIVFPLKNIMNDAYAKDLSKKIQSARRVQRQKGEYTGGVIPYGYQKDLNQKGHFIIDAETAPTVKKIFEWIAEGHSYSFVAKELNRLQIKSPKRGLWSYQTIRIMVKNRVYLGELIQGVNCVERKDVVKIENAHEAIIDMELFAKVEKNIDRIKSSVANVSRTKSSEEYLFSNMLVSKHNMKKMYQVHYYINGGEKLIKAYKTPKTYQKNGCANILIQIREETLIRCIEKVLAKYIDVLEVVERYIKSDRVQHFYYVKQRDLEEEVERLERKLKKTTEYLAAAYTDMMEGLISTKDYSLYRNQFLKDEKSLQMKLTEKRKESDILKQSLAMEMPYIRYLKQFKEAPKLSKELVQLLVEQIRVISSTDIEISFRFQDEFEALYDLYCQKA